MARAQCSIGHISITTGRSWQQESLLQRRVFTVPRLSLTPSHTLARKGIGCGGICRLPTGWLGRDVVLNPPILAVDFGLNLQLLAAEGSR
jgi:hypothetical protein